MSQPELYERLKDEAKTVDFWSQHRFFLLVAGAILLALFLVAIALNLYHSDGSAQLDLSRPGYQSVRDKVEKDTSDGAFSATGPLDESALNEFRTKYQNQAVRVKETKGFSPEALSNRALELDRAFQDPTDSGL